MKSISFELSGNAWHSFQTHPVGCEEPVLIKASLPKLLEMWRASDLGYHFFESPGGIEKPAKLNQVHQWLDSNTSIWAPVVEWRAHVPKQIELQDSRHTCVALHTLGYDYIQIAVRASFAERLTQLFAGA